jgi:hypothetical protein
VNPSSDLFGWATFVATFVGPVAAVLVTRLIDHRKDERQRQLGVFRALMANRAVGMNPDRIAALNLVQIEFAKKKGALTAWSNYMKNLSVRVAPEDQARHFREREHLYTLLLYEIAKVMGIKIEQLDILEGGYYPEGAVVMENEQNAIRRLFAQIALGERSLPIAVTQLPQDPPNPLSRTYVCRAAGNLMNGLILHAAYLSYWCRARQSSREPVLASASALMRQERRTRRSTRPVRGSGGGGRRRPRPRASSAAPGPALPWC